MLTRKQKTKTKRKERRNAKIKDFRFSSFIKIIYSDITIQVTMWWVYVK